MIHSVTSKTAIAIAGLALCITFEAQGADGRWYLRGDLGTSLLVNPDVTEFLGPVSDTRVDFDPGLRLGLAGGYRIEPWLAIEVEAGALFNSINGIGPQSVNASMTQVPLMANLVIQCNNFNRWVPFVGGGAGGVASVLDIDQRVDFGGGSMILQGSDADAVFAYQAFAGLRYEFNDAVGVGLIYRFMGAEGSSWDVRDDFGDDLHIQFEDVYSHSVSLLFQIRF